MSPDTYAFFVIKHHPSTKIKRDTPLTEYRALMRLRVGRRLFTQTECLDDGAVTFDVLALEVGKETAALADKANE